MFVKDSNCGGKTRVTPMKNSQDYLVLSGTSVAIQYKAPMGVFELVEKAMRRGNTKENEEMNRSQDDGIKDMDMIMGEVFHDPHYTIFNWFHVAQFWEGRTFKLKQVTPLLYIIEIGPSPMTRKRIKSWVGTDGWGVSSKLVAKLMTLVHVSEEWGCQDVRPTSFFQEKVLDHTLNLLANDWEMLTSRLGQRYVSKSDNSNTSHFQGRGVAQ